MSKELKATIRFVSMIALPLCFFNSLILSIVPTYFISGWFSRFLFSVFITFPQAVLYVSIVKRLSKG